MTSCDLPSPEQVALLAPRAGDRTFVDALLAEQRQLTAVEIFSKAHDEQQATSPRYRGLIPLSSPAPGQQYAFEVDLDKCTGCKACVTACHSLNGLDDGETWREVGVLISDDWRRPFQQVVTTACHHCIDPACLNGCPVLAYEKDEFTGIVRHLDDQCIGCQYCVLKCPYNVPKYSKTRGIVRKCDMCSQRLASGEAPACVQACPNEAIRITHVSHDATQIERSNFLPAAPDPAITLPTTRYISKSPLSRDLIPSNATEVTLQPPHWPLVVMLVLTQGAVGVFALMCIQSGPWQKTPAIAATAATLLGLGASVLHLGKPLKAWRFFLGLRRSWLSREIMTFGLFALLAIASIILTENRPLTCLTATVGLIAVFCSAKIYDDTPRPLWRGSRSIGKFFGTAALLGIGLTWLITAVGNIWLPIMLAFVTVVKIAGEHRILRRADDDRPDHVWPRDGDFFDWSLTQSALLMRDRLGLLTRIRFACAVTGGVVLPLTSLLAIDRGPIFAAVSFVLCLAGELSERYLFFRAVVPPRMP
jgi:formate dehydrogenase iron-sulfur subunit